MKKTDYIKVNRDLNEVMDKVAERLYRDWSECQVPSLEKSQQWVSRTIQSVLFPIDLPSAVIKYHEPKLQEKKWGPMGDMSYSAPEGKQDYARRKPAKTPEPSVERLKQQERMQKANDAWKVLDFELQKEWDSANMKSSRSGVHLFCGVYMSLLKDNKPIPSPLIPTTELIDYYLTRNT